MADSCKILIDDSDAHDVWLTSLKNVERIGVRVVHGGGLNGPVLFDEKTRSVIEAYIPFAPLHNPFALETILRAQKHIPDVPVYCMFDTDFHTTLPPEAFTYPIDREIAERYSLRRYGFHGIALQSVLEQLCTECERNNRAIPQKILMVHLGGGTSITAVLNGKSVATTMGVTPLEGAMMITRSGSVDPDIVRILNEEARLDVREVSTLLNKHSGFEGLLRSTDTKEIIERAVGGEEPEGLAVRIYVRSIVEHIFGYYGLLQGADALVFSGGIGFQNEHIRPRILEWTHIIGLHEKNTYAFRADETKVIFDAIQHA